MNFGLNVLKVILEAKNLKAGCGKIAGKRFRSREKCLLVIAIGLS